MTHTAYAYGITNRKALRREVPTMIQTAYADQEEKNTKLF